jgi:hypothetical protein
MVGQRNYLRRIQPDVPGLESKGKEPRSRNMVTFISWNHAQQIVHKRNGTSVP